MAPYTRGGVWTNVEDEVLRTAIAKYGLNQWSRVSSLLSRKTAKQAKARWTEWLDPTIKKVEWSKDEDEKLLHLAKLMPTQWRSIAPLVGRTANQCIERYQELLDDAETRQAMEDGKQDSLRLGSTDSAAAPPIGQSARFQVGDIDAAPESRPAKPDAVDMDDDEKEMLAEARARLANTQGKKAKRKDRERMLDESKRLALLQKRRELKQAGINMKLHKKNKTGMDYNADIPLEHTPAAVFYDTTDEHQANLRDRDRFEKTVRKHHISQGEQDNDGNQQRHEKSKHSDDGARNEILLRMEQTEQVSKRRKLELPPPQVQDDELERIIKQTRQEDNTKSRFEGEEEETGLGDVNSMEIDNENGYTAVANGTGMFDETPISHGARNSSDTRTSYEFNEINANLPTEIPTDGSKTTKNLLKDKLNSLPKPKNEIEIIIPEESEENEVVLSNTPVIEDRAERDERIAAEQQKEKQRQLEMRSSVLKKSLPRPKIDMSVFKKWIDEVTNESPEFLIRQEAVKLIISDALKYPEQNSQEDEEMADGNGEIVTDLDLKTRNQIEKLISDEAGAFDEADTVDQTQSFQSMKHDNLNQETLLERLMQLSSACNRYERDLSKVLGGYQKRQELFTEKLEQATNALKKEKEMYKIYQDFDQMEDIALRNRISRYEEENDDIIRKEYEAQNRYRELKLIFDSGN